MNNFRNHLFKKIHSQSPSQTMDIFERLQELQVQRHIYLQDPESRSIDEELQMRMRRNKKELMLISISGKAFFTVEDFLQAGFQASDLSVVSIHLKKKRSRDS